MGKQREWRRRVIPTRDPASWKSENADKTDTLALSCRFAWAARARMLAITCRTRTLLTLSAAQRTTTASPCADSAALLTTAPKNRAGGTLLTEANGLTKERTPDIKSEFILFSLLMVKHTTSILVTHLSKSE